MAYNVLIAEPNEDIQELLEILVGRRYRTLATDTFELDEVDMAVVDPTGHGGLELTRRLHQEGIPLVLISIYPPSADLLALDPIAYLEKPFTPRDLELALLLAESRVHTA